MLTTKHPAQDDNSAIQDGREEEACLCCGLHCQHGRCRQVRPDDFLPTPPPQNCKMVEEAGTPPDDPCNDPGTHPVQQTQAPEQQ